MGEQKDFGIHGPERLKQALEEYADQRSLGRGPAARMILSERLEKEGYL